MELQVINERHNPKVDGFVVERMQQLLHRFGKRLGAIQFRIQGVGDTEHESGKQCTIEANLISSGRVHVKAVEPNVYAAIQKAVARLDSLVRTKVDKRSHAATRHALARSKDPS